MKGAHVMLRKPRMTVVGDVTFLEAGISVRNLEVWTGVEGWQPSEVGVVFYPMWRVVRIVELGDSRMFPNPTKI